MGDDGEHAPEYKELGSGAWRRKGGGLRGEGQRGGARTVADRRIRVAISFAKTNKIRWFFNVFSIFCHLVSKMRQDVAKMREDRP